MRGGCCSTPTSSSSAFCPSYSWASTRRPVTRIGAAAWLGLASLFFYGWWSWAALPLLVTSILRQLPFGTGSAERPTSRGTRGAHSCGRCQSRDARVVQVFELLPADGQRDRRRRVGRVEPLNVVLPIGISFYTFTQIAFLVDCHQGKVEGDAPRPLPAVRQLLPARDRGACAASRANDAAVRRRGRPIEQSVEVRSGHCLVHDRSREEGADRRSERTGGQPTL